MAEDIVDPADRLNALIDQQSPRIARIFRTVVAALKDEIDLDAVSELIQRGKVDEALDNLREIADQLGVATNVAFASSGQDTATFLANADVGRIVFDQVNDRAVEAMRANQLTLVTEFNAEQRRATLAALNDGVARGLGPRDQARAFRDSIGLTETQQGHVANYRAALERAGLGGQGQTAALTRALRDKRGDAAVLRAARETQPIPKEKIDWMVTRYTERYVKYRSQVIARTEALGAVHQGSEEMYRQAVEAGTIEAEHLDRTWSTTLDGRERFTHELLNGQKRALGVPWMTIHGPIRYPGDKAAPASEIIQCRCSIITRIRR